mmetsp:Transcript_24369/g.57366  ORF Transcript_24369/g.57366 Transcript_24369/m.57366 type:complete len:279 (+) Transcript_24369:129-965(+)
MFSFWTKPNSKHAYYLSWISTILTVVFAIVGISYYESTGSVMCLVFGLENIVDFMSSVVVLWRFWASGTMTLEKEKTLKRRELRASMAISISMMILGIGTIATSSFDLAEGANLSDELDVVLILAILSVTVCGSLAYAKFHYAKCLNSESLYKDGVCSVIGTILAAALLVNTLIIRKMPHLWWADPSVSMICGFAALFLGIHSIYVAWKIRRIPVFSCSWWLMSRGDGKTYDKPPRSEISEESDGDDVEDDDAVVVDDGDAEAVKKGEESTTSLSEVV